MWTRNKTLDLPTPADALPGRGTPVALPERHEVLGTPMAGPFPDGLEVIDVGLGCFWGAERVFWQTPGVFTTLVGYAGGVTPNPTYEETCTGRTGHTEVVRVVFDPQKATLDQLLALFWESHDPTQGMRQGNDIGTTYRSAIYTSSPAQLEAALASRERYAAALATAGKGAITTEILPSTSFYNAEPYHQQYLHKVPGGYCNIGGTGVSCPIGGGTAYPNTAYPST